MSSVQYRTHSYFAVRIATNKKRRNRFDYAVRDTII